MTEEQELRQKIKSIVDDDLKTEQLMVICYNYALKQIRETKDAILKSIIGG